MYYSIAYSLVRVVDSLIHVEYALQYNISGILFILLEVLLSITNGFNKSGELTTSI